MFLRKPAPDAARRPVTEVGFSMWFPPALLGSLCVLFGVLWKRLPYRFLIAPAVDGVIGEQHARLLALLSAN